MNNYKIIFIDIDGTLRNNKKEVTPYTAKVIKNAVNYGLLIVLCSARYRKYTIGVSIESNASPLIISSNGADIYNYETHNTIYTKKLDSNTIKELYELATKYDTAIGLDSDVDRYVNRIRHPEREILIDDLEKVIAEHDITQVVLHDPDDIKVRKVIEELKRINNNKIEIKNVSKYLVDSSTQKPPNFFCDVGPKNINKGTGIKELLNYLQIPKEQAIAIGDGLNDLDMFYNVGYKVAMGNSIKQVLDASDEITLSNEENGVAEFLNKLIKKET